MAFSRTAPSSPVKNKTKPCSTEFIWSKRVCCLNGLKRSFFKKKIYIYRQVIWSLSVIFMPSHVRQREPELHWLSWCQYFVIRADNLLRVMLCVQGCITKCGLGGGLLADKQKDFGRNFFVVFQGQMFPAPCHSSTHPPTAHCRLRQ